MKSVLYQLLDVLVWFKMYVDSNPQTKNWERIETAEDAAETEEGALITGTVINVSKIKGFAFFKPDNRGGNEFIPPHLVTANSLVEGVRVRAEVEEYTESRSGESKTRVKRIEI